jgi:hypothetical protein
VKRDGGVYMTVTNLKSAGVHRLEGLEPRGSLAPTPSSGGMNFLGDRLFLTTFMLAEKAWTKTLGRI